MCRWLWMAVVVLGVGMGARGEDWRFYAVREEVAAGHSIEADGGLVLEGNGLENVDGRWVKRVEVKAGEYVVFNAKYQATGVATPVRSVLASVVWFDGKGRQVEQAEFPVSWPEKDEGGWVRVTGTYRVPEKTTQAQLEVRLRWAAKGRVVWKDVSLAKTSAPVARKVKVAAVNHRPRGTRSPTENLEQFAKFIDEAGGNKADIICLPEGITVCGTGKSYAEVAEAIPGASTAFLGECAKKNHAYVIAGIYEREGKTIYNTSVLLGRDGKLMGKYRKVCLPREEIDAGITPGKDYPVFDTDFGRIGMMVCWDVSYPEVARELSRRGAEMIFMPIWGGNETLARARAIENQVYLVASGYDFRTAVYDKAGEAMSKAGEGSGVIYAEMDLNRRMMWPWLGDWRARIWREGPGKEK